MVTKEKLKWIQKNLRYGDRKTIAQLVTADYTEVVAIITGTLWGEHGQEVIDATEKFLNDRIDREQKEKQKYSQKIKSNV